MGRNEMKGEPGLLFCLLLIMWLASHQPVMGRSLEGGVADEKDYYSPPPDPHGHGGSSHHGSHGTPCTSTPPSGGGGSSGDDPSHGTSPSPPSYGGGGGGSSSPPSAPFIPTPSSPSAPVVVYPLNPTPPATPMLPDTNSPPFTCDYWRTHPEAIWALLGYWCPLSQIFVLPAVSGLSRPSPTLLDALSNTRTDGVGALFREGTASFLNSLVNRSFAFTTQQVRDAFNAAVVSDKAAAAQAELFKKANDGHLIKH